MRFFNKTKKANVIILLILVLSSFFMLSGCGDSSVNITVITRFDGQDDNAGTVGIVKINNSENADGYESLEFEPGEVISLSATSNEGYRFEGWYTSSPATLLSEERNFEYTVEESVIIRAYFEEKPQYEATLYAYSKSLEMQTAELSAIGGYVKLGDTSENITHTDVGTYGLWGSVTVIAVPDENYNFKGWFIEPNFETRRISEDLEYPILIVNTTELYAYFEEKPIPTFSISTYGYTNHESHSQGGVITSNLEVLEGEEPSNTFIFELDATAIITATAEEGYDFMGWYSNSSLSVLISEEEEYTFTVTQDVMLFASFIEINGPIPLGYGTEEYPYQIAIKDHLEWVREKVNEAGNWSKNKWFEQTADISLFANIWTPIGLNSLNSFEGNYKGQGYIIDELTIAATHDNFVGLFGYVNGAIIEDLILRNPRILAYEDVDDVYVGMLVGYAADTSINKIAISALNSNSNIAIYGANDTEGNICIGGIIGYGEDLILTNSYSNLNIYAYERAVNTLDNEICIGGLVGELVGTNTSTAIIKDSFNISAHIKEYIEDGLYNTTYMGGIVGRISTATVERCYSANKVLEEAIFVEDEEIDSVTNHIGHIAGQSSESIHLNNYYNNDITRGTSGLGYSDNDVSNNNTGIAEINFTFSINLPNLFNNGGSWVMDTLNEINSYPVIYGVNNTYVKP